MGWGKKEKPRVEREEPEAIQVNLPRNIGNQMLEMDQRITALEALVNKVSVTGKSIARAAPTIPADDKNYVKQVIKEAEAHRQQSMYDRVQWQAAEIQSLQQQLRYAAIREERVEKMIGMVKKRTGADISTDSQGNVLIDMPDGKRELLSTGYVAHMNDKKLRG